MPAQPIFTMAQAALVAILISGPLGYLLAIVTGPKHEAIGRSRYFFFCMCALSAAAILQPKISVIREALVGPSWPLLLLAIVVPALAGYTLGFLSLLRALDFSGKRGFALLGLVPVVGALFFLLAPPVRGSRSTTPILATLGFILGGFAIVAVAAMLVRPA